jgi:hypothetical protein
MRSVRSWQRLFKTSHALPAPYRQRVSIVLDHIDEKATTVRTLIAVVGMESYPAMKSITGLPRRCC